MSYIIAQSYFKGEIKLNQEIYTLNLQGHSSEKIIKLPFPVEKNQLVTIRFSGKKNITIKDTVRYVGMSEWIEIDSSDVLYYVAAHQDDFENLEIHIGIN